MHTHVLKVDFEVFHSLKFIVQFIATKLQSYRCQSRGGVDITIVRLSV